MTAGAAVQPAYTTQFRSIEGQRLAYITAGDPAKPPLVFVHGWLSHKGVWDSTIAVYAQTHFCLAVDLLGFGESDKPRDGDYSIAAQSRRVLALADALGLEQFTWLGHSMGGQIGLFTALEHPQRLKQFVSVAGVVDAQLTPYLKRLYGFPIRIGASFPAIWSFTRLFMRFGWYRRIYDHSSVYQLRDPFPYDSVDRRMGLQRGIEMPAWRAYQAILDCDLGERVRGLQVPTLVIFGTRDNTVPTDSGRLLAERAPTARLVLIPDCGHFPSLEAPQAYMRALQEFVV